MFLGTKDDDDDDDDQTWNDMISGSLYKIVD